MPWSSLEDVPSNLKSLGLRWANRWAEVFDALVQQGEDEQTAARIAWDTVRKERGG